MGVNNLGTSSRPETPKHGSKSAHVRKQRISGEFGGAAHVNVLNGHTGREVNTRRKVVMITPRVNGNIHAAATKFPCKTSNVDVLSSRIGSAQRGGRAGMFRHERDPPNRERILDHAFVARFLYFS
jgi:hypothetical protein